MNLESGHVKTRLAPTTAIIISTQEPETMNNNKINYQSSFVVNKPSIKSS